MTTMRRLSRRFHRTLPAVLLLAVAACGKTPDTTEHARGVLSGANVVLALTIVFVVLAVGLIVALVGFDRFVRSRRALESAPPVPPAEETDEVVAGIVVGRGPVPKWLYAFYVLIPIFAFTYVATNVSIAPASPKSSAPAGTPKPTGPATSATIVAQGIKFDTNSLSLVANAPVTVHFDNKDGAISVPHTFTVWKSAADAAANTASAKIADSGTTTSTADVKFTTPSSGSLYFNCTIHPASMSGTIDLAPKK